MLENIPSTTGKSTWVGLPTAVQLVKSLIKRHLNTFCSVDSLRSSVKSEDMFVKFKSNRLILAAAVVLAMLEFCHVDDKQIQDRVTESLSNECFVDPMNIVFLRDAILNIFN